MYMYMYMYGMYMYVYMYEAEAEEVHSLNAAFSELAPTLERLQRKAKEDIDVRKSWSLPLAKTHWKMNS